VGEGIIEWPEESGEFYWNKQHYSGQFKVSDLGVEVPEMYEIHL